MLSPKFQVEPDGAGLLVLVNVTGVPAQAVAGAVNLFMLLEMTNAFVFTMVSVQPVALVTTSLTENVPPLVYVWIGLLSVDVVPSPKLQL